MWPNCIAQLSPFVYELCTDLPEFLRKAFIEAGINNEEIFVPIHLVSILGKCSTAAYLDCPNLPKHHIDNSQDDEEDPAEYLDEIGEYHWFDFDIVGLNKECLQLRLVLNEGDADCNDGIWGAVWERNTAELVANILNTGEQSRIEAVSKPLIEICESMQIWVPTTFEYGDDDNPTSWLSIKYVNNLNLEKFLGFAIRLCSVYRY